MAKRRFTFDDLEFHHTGRTIREQKASLTFPNQYTVNVYFRSDSTNRELPFEFELLYHGHKSPNITGDNIGYCSKADICEFIEKVQKYK